LVAALVPFLREQIRVTKTQKIPRDVFIKDKTRFAFWLSAMHVLAELYAHKELFETIAQGKQLIGVSDILGFPGMLSGGGGLLSETPALRGEVSPDPQAPLK